MIEPNVTQPFELVPHPEGVSLRNHTCIYCRRRKAEVTGFTREHVVGRNFAVGWTKGEWNLIAYACQDCNREKANLEDDISAILAGLTNDPALIDEVRRKVTGSKSRRTGKPVADSAEKMEISVPFGSALFKFSMVAPPQIDQGRVCELAWFHLQAIWYLQRYDDETRDGDTLPDAVVVTSANRRDWGNERFRWFQSHTQDWLLTFHGFTAGENFKASLRQCPNDERVRSFALEWNRQLRVVGFFGQPDIVDRHVAQAPLLETQQVAPNQYSRLEVPLAEADDSLFALKPEPRVASA
jgi:hypothetical protein